MQRWAEVGLAALIATGLARSDSDPPSEPPDEPSPPDAPLGMDATSGASPNSILLDWNPVAGATSYRVYYSSASPFPLGGAVRFDVSAPPATVTGLSANVPHHFSVVAIGSGGESPRSLTATATPMGTLFASILEPVAFGIVGDTLQVRASVEGSSIPTSVVARLRERSIPLTAPPQGSSVWSGSLVVSGAPSPESTYVSLTAVTATDSVTAYTPVLHDLKPHLQFTPFPGGVVGLSPHFSIRCLDDEAASCGIRVWAEGGSRELISAQREIDQEISLADYAEQSTDLVIIVQDRAGQTARADQRVAVTTNPNLVLLGTAGATLLDADANSLLAIDTSGGGRRILLVDGLGASNDTILSELRLEPP